jgi:hypothetical protein
MTVASADAFIASYDAKYAYNFWRPVTAIRAADSDGNPETIPDSAWVPLITTPNHPSYGSNNSTHSMAAAQALAAFFGTDHFNFTATSAEIERSFNKFTDAAKEGGKSRIYAGIHFSFDLAAGLQQGRKVGQYVADHYFQPVTGRGGEALRAVAAATVPGNENLRADLVQSLPAEAPTGWQAAGADASAPSGIDARTADLPGAALVQASASTIGPGLNGAGWGSFTEPTPDSDFTTPGTEGERGRTEPLSVLAHEQVPQLGHEHWEEGVMAETLTAGTRRTLSDAAFDDVDWLVGLHPFTT